METAIRFSIEGDRNVEEANSSSVRGGAGLPDELDSRLAGVRGGAWVQDSVDLTSRWTFVPGLRFDWSTANDRTTLSPRFSTSFDLSSTTSLGAAVGLYTQSPGYEKLLQSDFFIDLTDAAVDLDYERAVHVIVSFEKELGRGITARVEGYHKEFDRLVVGRLETEEERLARVSQYSFPSELEDSVPTDPIITSSPTNASAGRAYGVDFYVAREAAADRRWSGWLSYTLGKAERESYGRKFPFEYDRLHALSIVGGYRLSPRFDIAVTGRLSSGFPRTPAVGLRVAAVEDVGDLNGNSNRAELVPEIDAGGHLVYTVDYGGVENLNTARLPWYVRFDVRGTWKPGGPSGRWAVYFEVINALNRENAFRLEPKLEHDPTSELPRMIEEPAEAFPLVPTFGVRFRF
jgi:outer membrane receptor protein involved in Fe transport